jgi:hypothetical protein
MSGHRAERRPLAARTVLVVPGLLLLVGCAAGANPEVATPAADGSIAGFWLGLWHGLIAPVTFIISLFSDGVGIYEVHNSGGWYDAGFVLGLGFIVGGSSTGAHSASGRERGRPG